MGIVQERNIKVHVIYNNKYKSSGGCAKGRGNNNMNCFKVD